ncbi:MAG: DegT/DnrJ/EryC1/StrS family aminotransferase [Candidatus Peribacteraceae bacterium]
MPRTIHHTFGPHVDRASVSRMLRLSYAPWKYVRGGEGEKLRTELKEVVDGEAFLFASGRESLLAVLKAMNVQPGDEVIVQGYTCVVVPNAVQAAGCIPIYADIDPDTLNLTVETVSEKLSPRTRAVIVQHTFGIPGPVSALRTLLRGKNIGLIEDMAHVLVDRTDDRYGREGDYCILSFGRDKAISGVAGGAVVSRNRVTSNALRVLEAKAQDVSCWTVLRHLEYGPRMHSIVRPFAGTVFAKICIKILTYLQLIEPVLTAREKEGVMPRTLQRLPNACAALTRDSLKKLKNINQHRRMLTDLYLDAAKKNGWTYPTSISADLPLQKFPIFVQGADQIRRELRKQKIFLEDGWNTCTICPMDVSAEKVGYTQGSDPQAESVCMQILSLPTHPLTTREDAGKVLQIVKTLLVSN